MQTGNVTGFNYSYKNQSGEALNTLVNMLQDQAARIKDVYADSNALAVDGVNGSVLRTIKGEEFELSDKAHRDLAGRCNIPMNGYRWLGEAGHSDLRAQLVNRELPKTAGRVLIRGYDNKARALMSNSYKVIEQFEVLASIVPVIRERDLKLLSANLTESDMHLIVTDDKGLMVKVGDEVKNCYKISNNQIGQGKLVIEHFAYRLACLNGAITQPGKDAWLEQRHVGRNSEYLTASEKAIFMREFREKFTHAIDSDTLEKYVEKLQIAHTAEVKAETNVLFDSLRLMLDKDNKVLTDRERVLIAEEYIVEKGRSGANFFSVVQGITAAANRLEDYDRGIELQELGTTVLNWTPIKRDLLLNAVAA